MSNSECIDLKHDLTKVCIMSIVARVYQGNDLSTGFMQSVLFDLAGFTVYHLAIAPLIKETQSGMEEGPMKRLYETVVFISTIKIISGVLSGKDIKGSEFMNDLIFTIIGFSVYDIVTLDIINSQTITDPLMSTITHDLVQFGGMFTVVQLLNSRDLSDPTFVQGTIASLIGLVVADFFTSL